MTEYKAKSSYVDAVQSTGENIEDVQILIGSGAQFLDISVQTVGGPGRGAQKAVVVKSVKGIWTLRKDQWLVVMEDGSMTVMDDILFSKLFELWS